MRLPSEPKKPLSKPLSESAAGLRYFPQRLSSLGWAGPFPLGRKSGVETRLSPETLALKGRPWAILEGLDARSSFNPFNVRGGSCLLFRRDSCGSCCSRGELWILAVRSRESKGSTGWVSRKLSCVGIPLDIGSLDALELVRERLLLASLMWLSWRRGGGGTPLALLRFGLDEARGDLELPGEVCREGKVEEGRSLSPSSSGNGGESKSTVLARLRWLLLLDRCPVLEPIERRWGLKIEYDWGYNLSRLSI